MTPTPEQIAEARAAHDEVAPTYAAYIAATTRRAKAFAALIAAGWGPARISKEFGMTRARAQKIAELADKPERRQP